MYVTSVRFPDDLADQIRQAAEREGTTFAQWVRDAATIRLVHGASSAEVAELRERLDRVEEFLRTRGHRL